MQSPPVYDICTLSAFKENDIIISRFEPYLNHHINLSAPHRHTFYHLLLFTKGAGSHTIDFEEFEVKPHQIYFMIPGQVHSWNFKGFTDGYIINFSDSFFQSLLLNPAYIESFSFFNGSVKDAVINLPLDSFNRASKLLEEIIEEAEGKRVMSADLVRLLMLQLFIAISRLSVTVNNKGPASYNQILLKNFQKLIEDNYLSLKLPKEYADLLYITPNHLNALCKDLLGMQAGEVIRNRTLLEAKRLLTNLQLNINEIAFKLNFNDNSYFTKFFKKLEGITPEEFRRKILNHN
ncbi:AraC-like DNA-binding protein [Mucilaginibacter frigoritolerans]|uniref:AraC-like DNA-binding protein n=2 Tax=Mucilaginibacter frigoritolerans TaxID=652788 RepID=A0A562UGF7_9SPHI|nr:AraC-like DNA-binding protein [Mucilaginibacter frigoritolerans]